MTGEAPTVARAAVRATRPRQWLKNLLVLAAPLAAGRLLEIDVLVPTLVALASFCAASAAGYLVNDLVDAEADRHHPSKQHRPIASGELSEPRAVGLAVVLAGLALGTAALTSGPLAVLIAGYLLLQLAYSLRLKHEPVLDLALVAAGFLLRAVAGGLAAGVAVTDWFLLVAGFGALFVVSGKRYSELYTMGSASASRRSLARYSESYLRFVWTMAGSATVLAYCLWAFQQSPADGGTPWHAISVAPFVLGLLRYAVDIDGGLAAAPEDIVWRDRVLQLIGVAWLVALCAGIANG